MLALGVQHRFARDYARTLVSAALQTRARYKAVTCSWIKTAEAWLDIVVPLIHDAHERRGGGSRGFACGSPNNSWLPLIEKWPGIAQSQRGDLLSPSRRPKCHLSQRMAALEE